MALQNGALLVHRLRRTFQTGDTDLDTEVRVPSRAFAPDPDVNGSQAFQRPSRVQIIPLAPLDAWAGVTHDEPFLSPITKTVHIIVHVPAGPVELNVLVDAIQTMTAPLTCDTYHDNAPSVLLVVPELGGGGGLVVAGPL